MISEIILETETDVPSVTQRRGFRGRFCCNTLVPDTDMRLHCCHLPVTSPEAERPSEHTKSSGGICCQWTGAGILASDSVEMSYGGISAFRVSHGIGLCLRDVSQVPEIPECGNLGFGLNLCLCLRASFLSVRCNHRKGRDGFFFNASAELLIYCVPAPKYSPFVL